MEFRLEYANEAQFFDHLGMVGPCMHMWAATSPWRFTRVIRPIYIGELFRLPLFIYFFALIF